MQTREEILKNGADQLTKREDEGFIGYTPKGQWRENVEVFFGIDRWLTAGSPVRVKINLSALGSVSIEQAENFVEALQAAIRDAKVKQAELEQQLAAAEVK